MPEDRPNSGWAAGLGGGPTPVEDPEKNLPPWDRDNPAYGVGAGKDEKATHNISARITTRENRDLQKIVQHRRFPAIENTSDAIRVGLVMVRYWYATKSNDAAMKDALDLEMWENEQLARKRNRERVLSILESLETQMSEAKRLDYTNRLADLNAELNRYRKKLTDEELLGKANRLYVEYHIPKKSS